MIEVKWYTLDNVTTFDIDFHLIYLLSKTLLYHICIITNLRGKTSYITYNICDSKDIFPLIDIYAI